MRIIELIGSFCGLIVVGVIMYGIAGFFTRFAEIMNQVP